MIRGEYDLVVVGGGPAGATAATLVAKKGGRVLLLEKARFPRFQIGESLLPSTTQVICAMLGVQRELKAAGFVTKRGGTFLWGKHEEPWTFKFADSSVTKTLGFSEAYQVERSRFDEILLRNAERNGVEVHENRGVDRVIREQGRVCGVAWKDVDGGQRQTRCRFVVDASGHRSRICSELGPRRHSEFFKNVAIFRYFRGGKRLPAPNDGNVLTVAFEGGWFWYIPLSDTLTSVGAVISQEDAKTVLKQDDALERLIARCPSIGGTPRRCPTDRGGRLWESTNSEGLRLLQRTIGRRGDVFGWRCGLFYRPGIFNGRSHGDLCWASRGPQREPLSCRKPRRSRRIRRVSASL